jgi:hypothetical protein
MHDLLQVQVRAGRNSVVSGPVHDVRYGAAAADAIGGHPKISPSSATVTTGTTARLQLRAVRTKQSEKLRQSDTAGTCEKSISTTRVSAFQAVESDVARNRP